MGPGPCRAGLLQPLSGLVVATASLFQDAELVQHIHIVARILQDAFERFASGIEIAVGDVESCKIEQARLEAGLNLERLAVGLARAGAIADATANHAKEVEDHRIPGVRGEELLGDLSRFDPLAVPEIERRQRKAYRGIARALRKTGLQGGQPLLRLPAA